MQDARHGNKYRSARVSWPELRRGASLGGVSQAPTGLRRILFTATLIAFALGLLEVSSAIAGAVLGPRLNVDTRRTRDVLKEQTEGIRTLLTNPNTLVLLDSTLGWRYRPSHTSTDHVINAQGLRSRREYAVTPPPGVLRVAAFGDSFVYGTEVLNADAWPLLIEQASDRLEVLNYGVGGYGTDQALLLFARDGMQLGPRIVLIGFAPVDLRRTQNRYRRFLSTAEPPLVKPRFRIDSLGHLDLVPSPLRTRAEWEAVMEDPKRIFALAEGDELYDAARYADPLYDWSATVRLLTAAGERIWHRSLWRDRLLESGQFRPASEAFRLEHALMLAFADSVRARGAEPIFVLLPDHDSVEGIRTGAPSVYAPLRDSLEKNGSPTRVIDLMSAFAAAPATTSVESWFAPGGHYSAAGNRIVADWIRGILERR